MKHMVAWGTHSWFGQWLKLSQLQYQPIMVVLTLITSIPTLLTLKGQSKVAQVASIKVQWKKSLHQVDCKHSPTASRRLGYVSPPPLDPSCRLHHVHPRFFNRIVIVFTISHLCLMIHTHIFPSCLHIQLSALCSSAQLLKAFLAIHIDAVCASPLSQMPMYTVGVFSPMYGSFDL